MPKLSGRDELTRKKVKVTWDGDFENIVILYGDDTIGRFVNKQEFLSGKAFDLSTGKTVVVRLEQKGPFKAALFDIESRKFRAYDLLSRIAMEVFSW